MSVTINVNGNVQSLVVNVSGQGTSITANGDEVWSAGPSYPPYLTFSSASAFTLETVLNDAPWDGTMEYSTDATNWTTWGGEAINSSANGEVHYLYVRGSGNTVVSGGDVGSWMFGSSSGIACDGDIRTLLDYSDPENTTMAQSCFAYLFSDSPLVRAPDLPSETLSTQCYGFMFAGSDIATSPSLPATILAASCYISMFSDCANLVSVGSIAAETLANLAMRTMFQNCASLTSIPSLKALDYGTYSCMSMFSGCSLIKISDTQTGEYQTPYRIPAEGTGTSKSSSFTNMFTGTGGTFTDSPTINITYYTSNTIVG